MTDNATEKKATITLDAANSDRQFPAYQLSINAMDGETSGHGYRLMGPKYLGRSRNLRTVELDQRDADEIRAILDEVFPAKPTQDGPTWPVFTLQRWDWTSKSWETHGEYTSQRGEGNAYFAVSSQRASDTGPIRLLKDGVPVIDDDPDTYYDHDH